MKTNVKLVAGSIAGLLTVVGAIVGVVVWAGVESGSSSTVVIAGPDDVEPIASPSLDHELATTERTAVTMPTRAPDPVLEEIPYEPELDANGPIRVRRLIVSTGVSGHEPTNASDSFELGAQGRIYAFIDAVNATDEEISLSVVFEPEVGESTGHVSLAIPGSVARFRTWATTRHVYTPGRWTVVVRAPDGHVVGRRSFDVIDL